MLVRKMKSKEKRVEARRICAVARGFDYQLLRNHIAESELAWILLAVSCANL